MYYILIFILGFLAGVCVMWAIKKANPSTGSTPSTSSGQTSSPQASSGNIINPAQVRQHQENLQKILQLIQSKGRVDNNAVESALGVSASTAERYFDELERQGKIEQVGATGQAVYYRSKNP